MPWSFSCALKTSFLPFFPEGDCTDILPLLRKLRNVVGEEISHAEAENILNSGLFYYDVVHLATDSCWSGPYDNLTVFTQVKDAIL